MRDEELLLFASEFRAGMIADRPSLYCCYMIAAPLAALLRCHGIDAQLVESDLGHCNHFWLRLPDGRVLDPTADQFNDLFKLGLPKVYLGPPAVIHPDPLPPRAAGAG